MRNLISGFGLVENHPRPVCSPILKGIASRSADLCLSAYDVRNHGFGAVNRPNILSAAIFRAGSESDCGWLK